MTWYEIAGLILMGLGVLIALFVRTSTKKSKQTQKVSGKNNTAIQAGGDVTITASKGDDNE